MPFINIKNCTNCGTPHEWLFEGPTLKELRLIKKITVCEEYPYGMTQNKFALASDDGDPEALAALIWILHKRDKIKVPFDDLDLDLTPKNFEMKLTDEEQKAVDEAEAAEKAAKENEDPKETGIETE
jgi:hypothetical protein